MFVGRRHSEIVRERSLLCKPSLGRTIEHPDRTELGEGEGTREQALIFRMLAIREASHVY